jgi:hypothetical protein
MNGIELISKERDEQINKHGCSAEIDAEIDRIQYVKRYYKPVERKDAED